MSHLYENNLKKLTPGVYDYQNLPWRFLQKITAFILKKVILPFTKYILNCIGEQINCIS